MTAKTLLLSLLLSAAMIVPAAAQEKAPAKETPKQEAVKKEPVKKEPAKKAAAKTEAVKKEAVPEQKSILARKKEATPVETWIAAENDLIDPLSNADKESIFIMRNKHAVIRVIDVVERDVGAAVKACGKANPDIKNKIEGRFDQWKDAVHPVTKTAQKNLKAEIEKQTIVDASEFRNVLKLNDKAFEYGDKRTVKSPVSSPKACQLLIDSMDSTEDEMITLLQETLLPPSVIKSRADKQRSVAPARKNLGKDAK